MHVTALGLLLLPLSLFWAISPVRLLQLAFVAAVFEAGAALTVGGGFGLPPAMVPGLLFVASILLQYALGMRYPAEAPVLRTMAPLLALLGYALISEVVLPSAFAGSVMVWPQRPDALQPGPVPLAFNSGNITQPSYLIMNVAVAVATALFMTRKTIPYGRILGAYLLSGYVAVGLAFWQFAARVGGLPFPEDLLYSNPGWAIVEQNLGSVPRIQGSFSEPAGLAFYLSGLCFCCLWLSAQGCRVMRVALLLPLAILAMLLSTSTTGILTLAVGLPATLLLAGFGANRSASVRLLKRTAMLVLGGMIVLGPVFVLKPALLDSIGEVVTATLTKGDSDSYSERTGIDAAALASVGSTYGLGVGWGSFRTSSLLPGLLANAGLFGVAMVIWLFIRVGRLAARAKRAIPKHPARSVVDGFSAALCGQLAAALLSAPTIGSLGFFLQLGCVVGGAARMSMDARRPSHARPGAIRQPHEALPA
jgi:hypothetical protein